MDDEKKWKVSKQYRQFTELSQVFFINNLRA